MGLWHMSVPVRWRYLFQRLAGTYRGIRLVEFLWKTVIGILNRRLTTDIGFHDTLHGFQTGRGAGTSSLKANPLHQMAEMRKATLYKIFLDVQKVYIALDRDRHPEIMGG